MLLDMYHWYLSIKKVDLDRNLERALPEKKFNTKLSHRYGYTLGNNLKHSLESVLGPDTMRDACSKSVSHN